MRMADESSILRSNPLLFWFKNPLQMTKRSGYVDMQYLADDVYFLSFPQ